MVREKTFPSVWLYCTQLNTAQVNAFVITYTCISFLALSDLIKKKDKNKKQKKKIIYAFVITYTCISFLALSDLIKKKDKNKKQKKKIIDRTYFKFSNFSILKDLFAFKSVISEKLLHIDM